MNRRPRQQNGPYPRLAAAIDVAWLWNARVMWASNHRLGDRSPKRSYHQILGKASGRKRPMTGCESFGGCDLANTPGLMDDLAMPRYALIALFIVGCGTAAPKRYTYDASMIRQASDSKTAALTAMNRESGDLDTFQTKLESFGSAEFLAKKKPKVKKDGSRISVEVMIAKDNPATCIIEMNAERSMATLASMKSQYREAANRYELKFDKTVTEAGERFRVVHEVYSGEDKVTFVKYASARVGTGSAVCVHEGFGYRETLDRMFGHMMQTAREPSS